MGNNCAENDGNQKVEAETSARNEQIYDANGGASYKVPSIQMVLETT
jgi:hypothetical protein